MKHIYDLYRVTKQVKRGMDEIDRLIGDDINYPRDESKKVPLGIAVSLVKEDLKERYRMKYFYINDIFDDACKEGYLKRSMNGPIPWDNENVSAVSITKKGRELLDTILWIIPIGFLEALWHKHGKFIIGLIGLLTGAIGVITLTILTSLSKWLLDLIT